MAFPTSSLRRYGVAALVTGLAFLLVQVLQSILRPEFPGHIASPVFLLAIGLSAWYGGIGAGLLSSVLSFVTLDFFFLPPIYSLTPGWEDIPLVGLYLAATVAVSVLDGRRRRAEDDVRSSRERMHIARAIQARLMPVAPPNLPGFDLAGVSQPAEATGGDYFDFIPMRDGKIGIVVGDISGHGFASALLMAEARACLRALAQTNTDLREILARTNAMLNEDTAEGTFLTLFFACLDPPNRSLVYSGAGHEGHLLKCTGGRQRLRSTSRPLGLEEQFEVVTPPALNLGFGDILVLLSDGITEARSHSGEEFGIERTIEIVNGNRDKPAREMIELIYQSVYQFSNGRPPADDRTAVIVKVENRQPMQRAFWNQSG